MSRGEGGSGDTLSLPWIDGLLIEVGRLITDGTRIEGLDGRSGPLDSGADGAGLVAQHCPMYDVSAWADQCR